MKRGNQGIVILMVLFSVKGLYAEDIDLERIVITAARTPENQTQTSRKVDIITSEDIETSGARDLSQVIEDVTSLQISNYGGPGATKTIRMRGSTASQVLVLVDGRPINSPRDGEADLSTIPLDNIERIEVVHGPASTLYGSAAMGGVVHIITKNPPKEKLKTAVTTSFGTFRTYLERLYCGGRTTHAGYLITGEYQVSQGFRDNSNFDARDFNTKLTYSPNDQNDLVFNAGFYKSRVGAPGLITSPDNDDKQNNRKNYLSLDWSYAPDTRTTLRTKAYNNYDRLEFIENTAGSFFDTPFNKDIHTTQARGLDIQFDKFLFDRYQLVTGFNYVMNLNDSTTSSKHKYIVRAGYIHNQVELWNDFRVGLGARLDHYSNFGSQTSPSLSLSYGGNGKTKLRFVISRSFRAPTFNDLYWPDQGWVRGNPDLKPEKGITGEFGIDHEFSDFLATSLTYYRSDHKDLINWAEEAGVWMPTNVDSALIDGVEWENRFTLCRGLELNIGYTFLHAKNEETGNFLIYQPQHKTDVALEYKGRDGFSAELKGQFIGKRFHDAANTIEVKSFFVLGLHASKKLKKGITCFVAMDNLLNQKYQLVRDYPVPGFFVTSGLTLEF